MLLVPVVVGILLHKRFPNQTEFMVNGALKGCAWTMNRAANLVQAFVRRSTNDENPPSKASSGSKPPFDR